MSSRSASGWRQWAGTTKAERREVAAETLVSDKHAICIDCAGQNGSVTLLKKTRDGQVVDICATCASQQRGTMESSEMSNRTEISTAYAELRTAVYGKPGDGFVAEQIFRAAAASYYATQTTADRDAWLGSDAAGVLAEWFALWGDAPETSRGSEAPTYRREHHAHTILVGLKVKHARGYWNEPGPVIEPDKIADKNSPDFVNPSRNGAKSADKKPVILIQNLQDASDVKPTLAEELAAIPVTKSNEEIQEEIALAGAQEADARFNELIDDIRHGAMHFDERRNEQGVVMLIDNLWLRRDAVGTIRLETAGASDGVIIQTYKSGNTFTTISRFQIREWMKKVKRSAEYKKAQRDRAAEVLLPESIDVARLCATIRERCEDPRPPMQYMILPDNFRLGHQYHGDGLVLWHLSCPETIVSMGKASRDAWGRKWFLNSGWRDEVKSLIATLGIKKIEYTEEVAF